MPKQLLFLIHGIGVHDTDWAEEVDGPIKTLQKVSQQYASFQAKPLEDRIEFVPIHYDEIFQEIASQCQHDTEQIQQLDPTGTFSKSLSWMASAGEKEKNFLWSHVADIALYRFCATYRERVRSHVIAEIADRIEKAFAADGNATASVLAHSMGTAVAHDALHLLGTVRWGDRTNPFNPAHWRFNQIFMIANTSRFLQTEDREMKGAYESIVRPGPVEDPTSYCAAYWNVRHEADPVPFPRAFDPVGWKSYGAIPVRHYYEKNIHNLSHYLLNPAVHIPILRKLTTPKAVTPEEEIAAVNPNRFPQFGGELAFIQKAKLMALQLEEIKRALGDNPEPSNWIRSLVQFYQVVEAAR
ncbi:MAG: hypothetical protein HY282_16245 [Nitrospirae bacterium]|nr:hypothetical protein [Candidatus Manganitrophaceae bacterium]